MKFTDRDIDLIKTFYEGSADISKVIPALERAADETKYWLVQYDECGYRGKSKGKEITRAQASVLLGRNIWINGLAASIDHKIVRRDADDGYSLVLFIAPDTFSKI